MYEARLIEVVFPQLAGLLVERVDEEGGAVRIWVRSRNGESACPDCAAVSSAVHSRYVRQPADLPVGGRPVSILLAVRRFFCLNSRCARRTFAEQFQDLIGRRRRRTGPLLEMLDAVGLALAGRAGSRLAARMAVTVSRMTLLRSVRAMPEQPVVAPRVLGDDDSPRAPLRKATGQHLGGARWQRYELVLDPITSPSSG